MKLFLFALCFFCLALSVKAASFDCAKAKSPVETTICGDNTLSTLDENLDYQYRDALSKASDKDELRESQRAWLKTRPSNKAGLIQAYEDRASFLELAPFQQIKISKTEATQRCVDLSLDYKKCEVSEFGYLGSLAKQNLYYALYKYAGAQEADEHFSGLTIPVVFSETAENDLRLELIPLERADGNRGDKPFIDKFDNTIELPMAQDGTGHFDISNRFQRKDGRWVLMRPEVSNSH